MDNIDKDIAGVAGVTLAFSKFGWTLRERGRIDYGIDADVEIKTNSEYQSKHIAVQIKSGESYLKVKENGKISFSIDEWHYKYWLKSDRPVLIVFYDIDNNDVIWEQVCISNLQSSTKNHIIEIEPTKKITANSKEELESILSNYRPFEVFEVDPDCVNFEYSIHCYSEVKTVLDEINNDFANFRLKVNAQIASPNTRILTKLFIDFTKKYTLSQELLYENYCKSHWYIAELFMQLHDTEQKELIDIINQNKEILKSHIDIWNNNISDYSKLLNPTIPKKLQEAAKKLIFRIKEYIATLKIIIDIQNSILNISETK